MMSNSNNTVINQKEIRINQIGQYMKNVFGEKVIKLSLDGGFTCPNRDGTKSKDGCIFCSSTGSGDFASNIPDQIKLLSEKWPKGKYIAYFQNHTNTYAPVSELREKYLAALNYNSDIVGLAIATRPDCLTEEIYQLLEELNKKTFLWVELGLQTTCEETASTINRCYPLSTYDEAISRLSSLGIRTVVHLIFGLPKQIDSKSGDVIPETKEEILDSIRYVCRPLGFHNAVRSNCADNISSPIPSPSSDDFFNAKQEMREEQTSQKIQFIFGIKIHMLNIVRGSQMETLCPNYTPFSSIDEYVDLVIAALELIPPQITIHRMTADAPRSILMAPSWSYKKRTILNSINNELKTRNTWQGKKIIVKR